MKTLAIAILVFNPVISNIIKTSRHHGKKLNFFNIPLWVKEERMSTKTMGMGIIIIGIIIILVGLFAGYIGLSNSTAIGTNKLLMAGFGLIVSIVGVVLMLRKSK